MKITVAGVGYVGLSLAVLLAQNHEVTAITTTDAKADKLNQFISPIHDEEIERFFKEANVGERKLNLHTTTDKAAAYGSAELVIIATPTNYDDEHHFFDTSAVEDAIEWTLKVNPDVLMVIKSTIPVGYTESVKKKYGINKLCQILSWYGRNTVFIFAFDYFAMKVCKLTFKIGSGFPLFIGKTFLISIALLIIQSAKLVVKTNEA